MRAVGLTEKDIICHCESYKQGIATNHSDVMHWFPKHGKSMDTFRKAEAKVGSVTPDAPKEDAPTFDYPDKFTSGYYRVRKTWADTKVSGCA